MYLMLTVHKVLLTWAFKLETTDIEEVSKIFLANLFNHFQMVKNTYYIQYLDMRKTTTFGEITRLIKFTPIST